MHQARWLMGGCRALAVGRLRAQALPPIRASPSATGREIADFDDAEFDAFLEELVRESAPTGAGRGPGSAGFARTRGRDERGSATPAPLIPRDTIDVPAAFSSLLNGARSNFDLAKVARALTTHYGHRIFNGKGPPSSLVAQTLRQCRLMDLAPQASAFLKTIRRDLGLRAYLNCMAEEAYCEMVEMAPTRAHAQLWLDELVLNAVRLRGLMLSTLERRRTSNNEDWTEATDRLRSLQEQETRAHREAAESAEYTRPLSLRQRIVREMADNKALR